MDLRDGIGYFLPLSRALSRRWERQADLFAVDLLGTPGHLIAALKRLAADNLSPLFPHPGYVLFHYSHPPLLERIDYLAGLEGRTPSTPEAEKSRGN